MKRRIIFFSLCVLVLASAVVMFQFPHTEYTSNTVALSISPQEKIETARNIQKQTDATVQERHYLVAISTEINSKATPLSLVNYRFNMAMRPYEPQPNQLLAQIYNIEWPSSSQGEDRPKKMAFTTRFNHGAFNNTDLLELAPSHPLAIIETLLQQFSYYSGNKTLVLADGKHDFFYTPTSQGKVTRKWLDSSSSGNYQVLEQQDDWYLHHDFDGFPQSLHHTHTRTIEYESELLTVVQRTEITPVMNSTQLDWQISQFETKANSQLKGLATTQAPSSETIDASNFRNKFDEFVLSPDLSNAEQVGRYLAASGFDDFQDFLLNFDLTNDEQSLAIFALERSLTPEGESILARLIEDEMLDEQNRLRAIMSIAKMGEINSIVAFQTLESATNSEQTVIADAALLNIGILGNQSEALKSEVTQYLRRNLETNSESYNTLVSIDNLKNPELDNDVIAYLNSEHSDERMLAARILARNPEMDASMRHLATVESDPNVIREIVQSRLANVQNVGFDASYQSQLRQRIISEELTVPAKEMLFRYLMSGSEQQASENQEVARELLKTPELSQSMRKELEGVLQY